MNPGKVYFQSFVLVLKGSSDRGGRQDGGVPTVEDLKYLHRRKRDIWGGKEDRNDPTVFVQTPEVDIVKTLSLSTVL